MFKSIRHKCVKTITSSIVVFVFFTGNVAIPQEISKETLATFSTFSKGPAPTQEIEAFRAEVTHDIGFMTVVFSIADHFIEGNGKKEELVRVLADNFIDTKDLLKGQTIDLKSSGCEEGMVTIAFEAKGKKGEVRACLSEKGMVLAKEDPRWQIAEKYAVLILPGQEGPAVTQEKDLKGDDAP